MEVPTALDATLAAVYAGTIATLAVYGLHRLWLVRRFAWRAGPVGRHRLDESPSLTVQLPVFNERTVARRLLRAVGALEYPRDRLEIQVLDDSTDETRDIVDREVQRLVEAGMDARVLRRAHRNGFKAGALAAGQAVARGELLCVFDADFAPPPDFLRSLVGYFADPGVGMVQARWGHSNRDESLLTKAESTLLDGHFVIEHKVRHDHGLFFNFNGTAGIWRRAAVESAGGWQHDTLTEDLDLSYRAQLAGWRFVYAPHVVAPAEVPPTIAAFKSQQHRWAKGSVQVFRKLWRRLLTAEQPVRIKLEALAHLTGNVGYPLVVLLALLMPTLSTRRELVPQWAHAAVFGTCTLSVLLFYETSQRALGRPWRARMGDVVLAVALGIGMSVSQTAAVLGGLARRTGVFERTPKDGEAPRSRRYASRMRFPGLELAFAAWFCWAVADAVRVRAWGSLPFLLLFLAGFGWVGTLSLAHAWRSRRDDVGRHASAHARRENVAARETLGATVPEP